jgi:phage RecT family recombinase
MSDRLGALARRRADEIAGGSTPDIPADAEQRQSIFLWLRDPAQLEEFTTALPRGIDPDRFRRTVITAIKTTPEIQNCTHGSVLAAAMQAAQLGLYPGPLQHVIFRKRVANEGVALCEFLLGVSGIIELALRSPDVLDVQAHTVYEGDHFDFRYGDDPYLEHRPNMDADGTEAVRCAWTIIYYANGVTRFRVFLRSHIDALRRARERDPNFWSEYQIDDTGQPVVDPETTKPLRNPRFEATLHASLLRAERRWMRLTPEVGLGLTNDGKILDVAVVREQLGDELPAEPPAADEPAADEAPAVDERAGGDDAGADT